MSGASRAASSDLRKRRLRIIFDVAKFILFIALLVWAVSVGAERLGYNWQWYRVPRYFYTLEDGVFSIGPLLEGLLLTFHITWISLLLSFFFGLTTAVLRLSNSFTARLISRGYLEIIRNTPLLIQLFFIYFVLGPVLGIERFTAAILSLSLFEGAYASEIIRAGIVSISKGQWEAAYSLGLSPRQTYKRIILPQALRRVAPPLTSQAISLIKDSALVSTIAVYEMTMQAQVVISDTFLTFEIWFAVAAVYLVITTSLSLLVGRMEQHFKVEQ